MTVIIATAQKLAVIIWHMLTKVEPHEMAQVKDTTQRTDEAGLRQVQRRIKALKPSWDKRI